MRGVCVSIIGLIQRCFKVFKWLKALIQQYVIIVDLQVLSFWRVQ